MIRMLSPEKVAEALDVSRATLYRMIRREEFPGPVYVGSQARWPESDVQAYFERLIQQRDQKPKKAA